MDTELFLLHKGELSNRVFEELEANDLHGVENYVEITRFLQEINFIFEMFRYNSKRFWRKYNSMAQKKQKKTSMNIHDDYISINALISNLLSSGKTLAEAMERYIKENYEESSKECTDFFEYLHCAYDTCFSYRYLIRLRDFAQHGHLPINFNQKGFCFDVHQLLAKPHFTVNPTLKKELESLQFEVMNCYGDITTFSVHRTVAEFTMKLLQIYLEFLKIIEPKFQLSEKEFHEIAKNYPCNHADIESVPSPCFFYKISDNNIHAVTTEVRLELDRYASVVKSVYSAYKKMFENIERNSIKLRVRHDEPCIEVEFGNPCELESHHTR